MHSFLEIFSISDQPVAVAYMSKHGESDSE